MSDEMVLSPPLLQLLKLMEVQHDNTLSSIVEQTQQKWLRPPFKERWQAPPVHVESQDSFFSLMHELDLLNEKLSSKKQYDYACVFGTTLPFFIMRINYLIEQWKQGVRFNHLVFLSGRRPLDPSVEPTDLPLYVESDIPTYYWNHLPMPTEMKAISVTFIDSEMVYINGKVTRPTTADTIRDFLLTNPSPGSVLFVSEQPYCRYQHAIARLYMPSTFQIETIGSKTDTKNIAVLLDTLARWLFTEKAIAEKSNS